MSVSGSLPVWATAVIVMTTIRLHPASLMAILGPHGLRVLACFRAFQNPGLFRCSHLLVEAWKQANDDSHQNSPCPCRASRNPWARYPIGSGEACLSRASRVGCKHAPGCHAAGVTAHGRVAAPCAMHAMLQLARSRDCLGPRKTLARAPSAGVGDRVRRR